MERDTAGIPLGDDRWQVSGTATDAAIAAIEGAGCTVTVLLEDEDLAAHDQAADALARQAITEEEDGEPVG